METSKGVEMQLSSHLISAQWSVHTSYWLDPRRKGSQYLMNRSLCGHRRMVRRFGQDRQLLTLPVKIPNVLGRTAHCLVKTTAYYAIRPLLITSISLNKLKNIPNTSERDVV